MAKNRKLGKTTAQRKAMLRTQVTDLLVNEKITTTLARAKETQAIANSLIALAIKEKDNFEIILVDPLKFIDKYSKIAERVQSYLNTIDNVLSHITETTIIEIED